MIPRYNENPNSGMVRDDLGRWVSWDDFRKSEAMSRELAKALALRSGKSPIFWLKYAERNLDGAKCHG